MSKILFVTGSRADYGLLRKLILLFQSDSSFETHVAATGTHLSQKHGMTIGMIKTDGVKNLHSIPMDLNGDGPENISEAISHGTKGFAALFKILRPNLIIVLGDRFELWAATIPAAVFNIPLAHLHGGESTEGLIDEAVRHSITKMAHLHFCSHDLYRKRIVRMGESPDRVFNVGAVGLDRIRELTLLSKKEIEGILGFTFGSKNILCTFHPVTLNKDASTKETNALIESVRDFLGKNSDGRVLVTLPNADTYSEYIRMQWEKLADEFPKVLKTFINIGDLGYLSLMKNVDVILGNSSSGILEAPFLSKAVVDVGMRQQGRLRSGHIIHADGTKESITQALQIAFSSDFQEEVLKMSSIYGKGTASEEIFQKIKQVNLAALATKKFYDGDLI